MDEIRIRAGRSAEHEAISALALRSKGHWGYSAEFLQACKEELTYSAETCGSGNLWVAVADGTIVGFSSISGMPPSGDLDSLFVDPSVIGTGCGKTLLQYTLREAAARGFTQLELDADPGAASFYAHHGAVRIGSSPSGSIAGRVLPRLRFSVRRASPQ